MADKNFTQQDFEKVLANFMKSQPDMVYLLNTAGVYTPTNTPINDVQISFLRAIKNSSRFRQSVADYMGKAINQGTLNFAGADDAYLNDIGSAIGVTTINPNYASQNLGKTDTSGSAPASSGSSNSSSSGSGGGFFSTVFSGQNVSNLLNTGLTALSTSLTAKANQGTEERALQSQQLSIQQLQAQQQLAEAQAAAASAQKKGMPGWGWVLIGVGALAMVTIITVVIVKKGRARRAANG